jgi:hypothetical protein
LIVSACSANFWHYVTTVVYDALAAYERALEPKKLFMLSAGYFDTYVRDFEFASTPTRDWFVTHLKLSVNFIGSGLTCGVV